MLEHDVAAGMDAFRRGRLRVRRNLHLGVGFLAATAGATGPGRFRFHRARTKAGEFSVLEAGTGAPIVMLHGLGGTKASFLPSVAALAGSFRVIAVDMLGFGDSSKPLGALLQPVVPGRRDHEAAGHAGAAARARRRPQPRRPRRDGARVPASGSHRRARPDDSGDGLAARAPLGSVPAVRAARAGAFPDRPAARRRGVHAVDDSRRRHARGRRRRSTSSSASSRPRAGAPPSTPPPGTSISTSRTGTTGFWTRLRDAVPRVALHMGPAGPARVHRLHEARGAGAAGGPPRGAGLRAPAADRAAAADACRDREVPAGRWPPDVGH